MALGPDGSLWIGIFRVSLARLDKDGHWQTFTQTSTQGGLPNDVVYALVPGPGGSLWAGTNGGLARLDKDGHWQTYTQTSTNGGLPNDLVWALAPGPDGSVWAGTIGALGHLKGAVGQTLRIVEVIGKVGEITQAEQTVAVVASDDNYLTPPAMLHYAWHMTEIGLLSDRPEPEIKTRSPAYRATFDKVAHIGSASAPLIATAIGASRRTLTLKLCCPGRTLFGTI